MVRLDACSKMELRLMMKTSSHSATAIVTLSSATFYYVYEMNRCSRYRRVQSSHL